MKLSLSSTAFHYTYRDGKAVFAPEEGISRCAEAGFRHMDMNFIAAGRGNNPLTRDDWESWIRTIAENAEKNGITVGQTHACWWMHKLEDPAVLQSTENMVFRSLQASSMLGERPWVSVHTFSRYDEQSYDAKGTLDYNYDLLCRLGDYAEKIGVRLAVENVFLIENAIDYAARAEELAELVAKLNAPIYGICWDFGHANMAKVDHLQALDIVKPYLRVVNANDNKAKTDEHGVPFFGTVPWEKVMKKLKEIGYEGDLNLTVRTFAQTSNPKMQTEALKMLHRVGTELIDIYDQA